MTFWSAPHSVLPITFKTLRVFKHFFLTYLRQGTNNLLSNINPRNLVSSTTGIGLLYRKSCGSKWRSLFWHICIDCFCLTESKTVVSCPLLKFIQTKLQLTFDDTQIWISSTYYEQSTPGFKHCVMLLIFTENKVTDRMLPWGTPISCRWGSEKVDPTQTLKIYLLKILK